MPKLQAVYHIHVSFKVLCSKYNKFPLVVSQRMMKKK